MQFSYSCEAGKNFLVLNVKEYSHIFKVRRVAIGDELNFCNLVDNIIYRYKIDSINKKEAHLSLVNAEKVKKTTTKNIHIGWCVVDPKIIEKHIAMLNEMGVEKISFVYAKFSQKNHKIDEKRVERILINSSQQCGRTSLMQIEIIKSLEEFLTLYPKSAIIDFSKNYIEDSTKIDSFLVGPEGGFSTKERQLFEHRDIFGIKSSYILRSETAVTGICAKIVL